MNLLLHGLEAPRIIRGNSLEQRLTDVTEAQRVDVILTNPPFGGEEERGILSNFPEDKQTAETALLFLQLIMRFRLHATVAEFLRQEVYRHDGIPFFSRKHDVLPSFQIKDDMVAAVLRPEHPLVVVVHNEMQLVSFCSSYRFLPEAWSGCPEKR